MPEYVISKVIEALNDLSKSVRGSRILLLGLAYKSDVDDDRESPTYVIMAELEKRGAIVDYNDPNVPFIRKGRASHRVASRSSQPITGDYDAFVICTAHKEYCELDFSDWDVPLIDSRNCARIKPSRFYAA
jgi:UDP-N-acetyl-D-glucosamine dehydrogenase